MCLVLGDRGLQRSLQCLLEVVRIERLAQEVAGPAADGLDNGLGLAVPGDHDDRNLAADALERAQRVQTAHAGQQHVERDQIRALALCDSDRFFSRGCGRHAVAESIGEGRHPSLGTGIIIDDEKSNRFVLSAFRHAASE